MEQLDLNKFQEPDRKTPINNLCTEIYEFGDKILSALKYRENIPIEVISACLFIKMLNAYKATYLFINTEYLRAEAHVLLRYLLEALFILKACVEDEAFLFEYIKSDEAYRLKIATVITKDPETFKDADTSKIEETRVELKSIVDAEGIKAIRTETLAIKAGLHDLYNSAYRIFSNITHIGIRSLEEYVDLDEHENIKGLNMCPHEKDSLNLYVALIEAQLIGYKCMGKIFDLDIDKGIDDLHTRLVPLSERM